MIQEITVPRIKLGDWVSGGIDWMTDNWAGLFRVITNVVQWMVDLLAGALVAVPTPVMILALALIAWCVRSWKLGLGSIAFFGLIWSMGQWTTSMQTLSLVLISTLFAVLISVPLGIWAARNRAVSAVLRPILDFMQTMPAFVYLIPAITFFGIGVVPGVISTLIFALPPGVRMTELGIRNVDAETVEAGESFGATPRQILQGIQLPLAMPSIMAGINQVIMLSLSMAVIAGMVGADGLGKQVVTAISTLNISLGVEAGLAVVFLAIYLDRITNALGQPADYGSSLLGHLRSRRAAHGKTGLGWFGKLVVPLVALALVAGFSIYDNAADGADEPGSKGTISFGYIPSWSDGRSTAFLLKNRLEEMGYKVELTGMNDAAVLYAGLDRGDVDLYPSAWPEVTHADYMKKYSSSIDDIGTYYDGAKLTLAVPSYSKLKSIEDLKGKSSQYGGRIVGIEPGAGLTKATKTQVIPQYGLDEYKLVTSSTPAMLTEVQKATAAKRDIVVTLWRPFWANGKFEMRDLEDPKGALGEAEGLHFLGKKGFADEFPEAAEYISQVKLDDKEYNSLEDTVVNKYPEGQEPKAVDDWLAKNPDVLPAVEK